MVTTDKIEHSALMISLFKLAAGNTLFNLLKSIENIILFCFT